jgi:hypothetical protein
MTDGRAEIRARATRLAAMAEEAEREGRPHAARMLRAAAAMLVRAAARVEAIEAMLASARRTATRTRREEWPRPNARRPPR